MNSLIAAKEITTNQAITWAKAKTVNTNLGEILNLGSLAANEVTTLRTKMVASSFFLPTDLLTAPDWKISPIYVLPANHFHQIGEAIFSKCTVHSDCDIDLMVHAKTIGISLRQNRITGKRYAALKLWYGSPPQALLDESAANLAAIYSNRLAAMTRFINTNWKLESL